MSLNWRQFELGVLRPTLTELAAVMPAPEVAVRLVGETLWHESDRLRALGQYPRRNLDDASVAPGSLPVFGPGLGIASIERPTWDWMAETHDHILGYRAYAALAYDLRLNVVACRLRYFLDPMALPLRGIGDDGKPIDPDDDIKARATYWWKVYNRGQIDRRPDYFANVIGMPWAL